MDKQIKGNSGIKSIINSIKLQIAIALGLKKGTKDYLNNYRPDVRDFSENTGTLTIPLDDGEKTFEWTYQKETLTNYDPKYYEGVFESAQHEQQYLDEKAYYAACSAALSMLEEANLCADIPEVSEIIIEAFEQVRECKSENEVHLIIADAQSKIDKYRTIDPEKQFSGYNIPK